jgi:hypothetical protein
MIAAMSDSLKRRLGIAVKRKTLTRELADGADPIATPQRARLASQLTSDRRRRQTIRTWRRTIADARRPGSTRVMAGIINREAVLDAEDAIQAMIERLGRPEPVTVNGMALVVRLMTDGVSSPVYNPAARDTLRRRGLLTTAELDRNRSELLIAA